MKKNFSLINFATEVLIFTATVEVIIYSRLFFPQLPLEVHKIITNFNLLTTSANSEEQTPPLFMHQNLNFR